MFRSPRMKKKSPTAADRMASTSRFEPTRSRLPLNETVALVFHPALNAPAATYLAECRIAPIARKPRPIDLSDIVLCLSNGGDDQRRGVAPSVASSGSAAPASSPGELWIFGSWLGCGALGLGG